MTPDEQITEQMIVDGRRRGGVGWIERVNPARPDEIVGRVAEADADLARTAVAAAHRTFDGWAGTPAQERLAALHAAADRIETLVEDVAPVLCDELGKVIGDCRGEIRFAAITLRDMLGRAERILAEPRVVESEPRYLEIRQVPYGVVGAVTPWNAPVILALLKVAPALATGNTMVVKPSPVAPLAVTRVLAAIADELPAGVLNVVHGGAEVGRVITGDERVAKVAFTGGLATGRAIMRNAAATVKPLVLELGGNDAAILLDDVTLDDATVERLVHATFITTGQVCMAAKRILVHRSRYEEVLEAYRAVADKALVVGDPRDEATTIGPLALPATRTHIADLVERARRDGARVDDLGTVADPDLVERGWFLRPTVVTDVAADHPIVTTEQFGPTVPILPFDDVDEAVALANGDDLGLASSVWSANEEQALTVARRLRTGTTFVNTHNRSGMALDAPFGGRGLSGFGREYSDAGVREYLQSHAIHAPAPFRPGATDAGDAGYPA